MEPWEIVWWILTMFTTFVRLKYFWQGNKIKRRKSAKDVSRKFMVYTHISYWIMFLHNIAIADIMDQVFWGFGIFTTAYCVVMLYRYREPRIGALRWIKDSFYSKEEGGIIF